MVTIELKGLHTVKANGHTYYYAWRGGPRIHAVPGTPEFQKAYNDAVADYRTPETNRFKSIVVAYKASDAYKGLADSTRRNWSPWLDRIIDHFGELRISLFDKPEIIRKDIRKWRSGYADKPRTADYGMQVLSRVLAHAVDPMGKIAANPCEGIKGLYSVDRSDIIWTDDDIAHLKKTCSKEVAFAVDLAAHTGLRASDLVKLSWTHIGDDMIAMKTGKSKQRRTAIVPLYQELRDLLARIPRNSPVILTSSTKRPWAKDGLSSSFAAAKHKAWPEGDDLHFHDLRGTAATKFYLAGLSTREIAEIMAWEEDYVERIIRRYVGRAAAIKERIRKLDEARKRT